MGQEAVLRMRATRGIKCEAFHGNFFIRSSDLLALPTVSPDNSYAFQLTLDENLAVPVACFQTAMLYTASHGERRIRIMTISLPVTTDMGTLYRNIDQRAVVVLLTKMAVERAITARLEDARDALVNKCVDMLGVYKASFASPGANPQLLACDNLKLLPLMTLSIIKCVCGVCFLWSLRIYSLTLDGLSYTASASWRFADSVGCAIICVLFVAHPQHRNSHQVHSSVPLRALPYGARSRIAGTVG